MWREKDWKLITYPRHRRRRHPRAEEARGELYHLRSDPDEFENLYEDRAHLGGTRERLQNELLMHLAGAWSRFPRRTSKPPL